jgi:hypothetical protein
MFAAVAKALKAWRTLTYIKVAYCKSSGSFAILAAIRRASSLVSNLAADRYQWQRNKPLESQ